MDNTTKLIPDWLDIEYDSMNDAFIPLVAACVIVIAGIYLKNWIVKHKRKTKRGCLWWIKRCLKKISRIL